ncbi:hypothetical protein H5410_002942 [Solanum commersonii]|uniref:Uncharacterized protein n=1 Tax=Solanum commersonii TaxID=4109 RepID=A0A9J6B3E4_SOLCO|nr:hypothetical protein H5410_002942 [Solanum commersonii]
MEVCEGRLNYPVKINARNGSRDSQSLFLVGKNSARRGRDQVEPLVEHLEFEAKHGHYLAKRNKKTKKRRLEDHLMHSVSR